MQAQKVDGQDKIDVPVEMVEDLSLTLDDLVIRRY